MKIVQIQKSTLQKTITLSVQYLGTIPTEVINVTTAKQMFEACKDNLPVDVAVCTAAVSDFKVKNYSEEKIKKEGLEDFNLELEKNIDILSYM